MVTNADAVITRFDVFDRKANEAEGTDERQVLRLFAKRTLAGEFDLEDVVREDFEETLSEFLKAKPRKLPDVMDFLGEEAGEDDEEDGLGGSVVPEKYRIKYGVTQRCGDDVAETLSAYVTLPRATKKDIDGGLDRAKLREVADANGLGGKLDNYEAATNKNGEALNGGLIRMNISNIMRGMVRRGERVVIGDRVWEVKPAAEKPVVKKAKARNAVANSKKGTRKTK